MSSTNSGVVEFHSVTRRFGAVQALRDFSLQLNPGELISLLGPSGCGKTTALRILAGIDSVYEGSITIDGQDLRGVAANKRNFGMVFQSYSLFPNMNAVENVAYGLRVRGVDSDKRNKKALELLEMVGLGAQALRRPTQLSGGQQQRVALARALAVQPRVLLLDEPLSALDAQVRTQLRDEIRRLQTSLGITTLLVTHDQEEAMAVSDRVGVMNHGVLEQIDIPANLYNKPTSTFVAGFVGSTNYIPGIAHTKNEILVLDQHLEVSEYSTEIKKGEEIRALVRPEAINVSKGDADDRAIIITKSFLGPITRIGIDAGHGSLIYAELSSKEAKKLDTGDRVKLHIATESVMVESV